MINKYTWLFAIISVAILFLLFSNRTKFATEKGSLQQNVSTLNDSLRFKNGTIQYLQQMLDFNYKIGAPFLREVELVEYTGNGDKQVSKLIKSAKKKFVVRYSTTGCNKCIDLLFKNKKRLQLITQKFNLIVFVDFKTFADYDQWERVSGINKEVYLVSKKTFPFDSIFEHNSYCFIIDEGLNANSFFIPRNEFKEELDNYIASQIRIQ
ncbi:hypothetical protein [Mucilaginibacter sp. 44-25]|uniref:hypothetical protein n=1 Tax=Mucilaginibacter sp. 44-25 TaxID=1895794 RepID=UPI000966FD7B|nr:hypothetical protein [Mucilaginibacter sp. 44-25]OJW17210.1 MAG: hypothetical protein BGO48_06550 [Mucilaginibacter sp. 44-25]